MDDIQSLVILVNKDFSLELSHKLSLAALKEQLTEYINHLINHNFEKLVYYLYRIDVNEHKIKQLMQQQGGENAAETIAQLIIDRQLQKIESRRQFKQQDNTINEEEKW